MKKNSGLIVLIIAGIVFLLAIKFDLMPGVRSFNSSSEVKQSSFDAPIIHEDGIQKTYYDNGQVRTETPYKNNKIDGDVITYRNDGSIQSKATYVNGKQAGETIVYYPSGGIEKVYTYKNNKLDGPVMAYDEEG